MTETELLYLCDPKNANTGKAPWIYWTTELYSHGRYIRKYAFFPRHLPLIVDGDHGGIMGTDVPFKYELESDAPVFFTFSKIKAQKYRELTGKRSYVIMWPAVYYRRKYKIRQDKNAIGTIAFAAHSVPGIDNVSDIEKYVFQLKALPARYQPITVCLHMHDINKGLYKIFQKHGLPVVTAGNTSDCSFIERFYELIQKHSFSTSNMIGSYSSLSIEMGIPFFIYGEPAKFINRNEKNSPFGEYDVYKEFPIYKRMYEKMQYRDFKGCIDQSFKDEVETWCGIQDRISRKKMLVILWISFIKWIVRPNNIIRLIKYNLRQVIRKSN